MSVDIRGFAFVPPGITVSSGTTVTWTNRDPTSHTVTSSSAPPGQAFDSGFLAQGGSFSLTFTVPGTYQYFCQPHPFMTGTVTVR